MGFTDQAVMLDVAAWAGNVSSSVLIIFINKLLMQRKGYNFHYDLLLFTITADMSIVSLNLSLMLNPVSFYQIAKLLVIPFICGVERVWLGRAFPPRVVASVAVVVVGVAIVYAALAWGLDMTVTDLTLEHNPLGVTVAALSVASSGMQQILCRALQQRHGLSSHELLAVTAPAQGYSLMVLGPLLDRVVSRAWVFGFAWNVPALVCLSASCAAAVAVNLSQFMCLGRFSAVSYQVLGHSKTVLVLVGGWAFLGDVITPRQAAGMALAVAGMVAYGLATSIGSAGPAAPPATPPRRRSSAGLRPSASPQVGSGSGDVRVDIVVSSSSSSHARRLASPDAHLKQGGKSVSEASLAA